MSEHLVVAPADPADPSLRALVEAHLQDMVATTPDPRSRHALDHEAMFAPGTSVWVARLDGHVVGCGALQPVAADPGAAEVKAMRTTADARGRGVGTAVLRHLVAEGRRRGLGRLVLETGAQAFFAPARRLYAAHGFVERGPFGSYAEDPSSVFMCLDLDLGPGERP
ncbi:GNAT family N-acetyltransferase [Nocardioides sp. CFH 31398]|uniref:GNAT family N-acetyltransferase n=1 Tax=Nocardioides sp. CFH 31398 TaxID=2919579 RepID=UPI001F053B31|nr:GNAT family N-acetyltransferase [Nocardioides sp. CFH 31398]MCH1866943.1 GNAT family N-acetyltransferase [Nocardioides sp. CFH 31398]